MKYNSTRDNNIVKSSSQCILQGISSEGGLFVPSDIDDIHFDIKDFADKSYNDIAKRILSAFLTDFSDKQLDYCVSNAYNTSNFATEDIFNLNTFDEFSVLELTTGRTCAFKDAALSILPFLINCAKKNMKDENKTVILTATSGDTGKAAMEGFADVANTEVFVFYPHNGVSPLQLKQMLTQKGANVHAYAIRGNFDDAQTAVKNVFNDRIFKEKISDKKAELSSANSINIGRLIPQVVYYYYAYIKLADAGVIKMGAPVNFCVPTGNFGNILAGYYAYKTGLPVNKLICASNSNNVLTDFFNTKKYDKNREFKRTISPSMDILISSNLERLVYEISDRNDIKTKRCMNELKSSGVYEINDSHIFDMFYADYATEEEICSAIKSVYEKYAYLLDTHTAAGYKALESYKNTISDACHTVLLSTASPYKFASDVLYALSEESQQDPMRAVELLNTRTNAAVPKPLARLSELSAKQETVINTDEITEIILQNL